MVFFLLFFPLIMAGCAALIPSNRLRPWLIPTTAIIHLGVTVAALMRPQATGAEHWLFLDPPGKLVSVIVGTLYLFCSLYMLPYLHQHLAQKSRLFTVCFISFLSASTLVAWAQHLGLLWVAIEATTLVTAPLIYFNHSQASIEAVWKYLLICSVGIALALLGTFFIAYASLHAGFEPTLIYTRLVQHAPQLSKVWLHAAFVLLLVGYGTKMGLAPMHTWKPDAYGESPGVVGALFAGGLTTCAFLALLRIYHICAAAGEHAYMARLLLFIGFFSMAVAAIFMIRQKDFKRMLAYSSVEHMGILMFGLGIGAPALFGTLLHLLTNSLTKGVLFLSAGNIHRAFGSKSTDSVRGALRLVPLSAALFLTGFIAITGSPPFGPFISEFSILTGAFASHHFLAGGIFLALLLLVFIGMGATVMHVVQGEAPEALVQHPRYRDTLATTLPIICLMGLVLLIGLYIPSPLRDLIQDAVKFLEVRP